MSFKNLTASLLLLTAFAIQGQDNLPTKAELSNLSQTFDFSNSITSLDGYLLSAPGETPNNFMFIDQPNTNELGIHLTTTLFKKNRSGMEKTGRILTYVGVPLAILGGFMVAGADELYYRCTNGNCTGDARGGFGIVALAAGVGLGATGGVLWSIGSKK